MSDIRQVIAEEVAQSEAYEALRAAILAQVDDDRFDSPYASDDASAPGFIQVDGQLALAPLAAAVIDALRPPA